jgi:hypothetical protein
MVYIWTTTSKTLSVGVNGRVAGPLVMSPTPTWDTWKFGSVTVHLTAGSNTLALIFNLGAPEQLTAYLNLHHPIEADGLDIWWLDWCCDNSYATINITPDSWINYNYAKEEWHEDKGGLGCFSARKGRCDSARYFQPRHPTQAGSLCYFYTVARALWARGTPARKHFERSLDTPESQCSIGFPACVGVRNGQHAEIMPASQPLNPLQGSPS